MRSFFLKDGKLFIDKDCTKLVPHDNPTYEILRRIKIPSHLTDVIVYEQTYENALTRLMFVGSDSKGRRQYFYGKLHVQKRNDNRNKVFVKVYNIIGDINSFIDKHLSDYSKKNDISHQLAVFMLMETSFFIRTGKMRYLKENETVGLLTLKNKHLRRRRDSIVVSFVGKDKVSHEFVIRRTDRLYRPLSRLIVENKPEDFLFNKLSEKKIYTFISRFGIRIKDLRTYGVNYTFLYNFWTNVKSLSPLPSIKKLISLSLKQTAEAVGHSPSISKHAYMATTVLELVQDKNILETIADTTLEEFVALTLGYINNREVING